MNLAQLETVLDKLWQEKWQFRINIVKNFIKLNERTDLEEQDIENIDNKIFKYNLTMQDIRNEEQKILKLINRYDLPVPKITSELIGEVGYKAYKIYMFPLDFETDIIEFFENIKYLPTNLTKIKMTEDKIWFIVKEFNKANSIKCKLEYELKQGKEHLTSFLEKLGIKWWKSDTEPLDEKSTQFNNDQEDILKAIKTIEFYVGKKIHSFYLHNKNTNKPFPTHPFL